MRFFQWLLLLVVLVGCGNVENKQIDKSVAKSFRIKDGKFLIKDGKFAVGEGACGCCGGCPSCIRITLSGLPLYLNHLNGTHSIAGTQVTGAGTPEDTSDDTWSYDLNMIILDTSDLLPCHVDVGGYSSAITLGCANDGQFAATLTAGFNPGSPTTVYAFSSTVGYPLVLGENEITGFYGSGCAEEGQPDTYVDEYFDGVILDGVILSEFTASLTITAEECCCASRTVTWAGLGGDLEQFNGTHTLILDEENSDETVCRYKLIYSDLLELPCAVDPMATYDAELSLSVMADGDWSAAIQLLAPSTTASYAERFFGGGGYANWSVCPEGGGFPFGDTFYEEFATLGACVEAAEFRGGAGGEGNFRDGGEAINFRN